MWSRLPDSVNYHLRQNWFPESKVFVGIRTAFSDTMLRCEALEQVAEEKTDSIVPTISWKHTTNLEKNESVGWSHWSTGETSSTITSGAKVELNPLPPLLDPWGILTSLYFLSLKSFKFSTEQVQNAWGRSVLSCLLFLSCQGWGQYSYIRLSTIQLPRRAESIRQAGLLDLLSVCAASKTQGISEFFWRCWEKTNPVHSSLKGYS